MPVYTKNAAKTVSQSVEGGKSLFILALLFTGQLFASTFTAFDFPNATETLVSGNNQRGLISGIYSDVNGSHGYLRHPNGSFSTINVAAGSVASVSIPNMNNAVTGAYSDAALVVHGFIYSGADKVVTFDVPGATNTYPVSINDQGTVTGTAHMNSTTYGFVRRSDGTIATFLAQNAATYPNSINNAGVLTGYYDAAQPAAFIRSASGTITTIQPPNTTTGGSFGVSIDSGGYVAGYYFITGPRNRPVQIGFSYNPDGSFTPIIIPNAAQLFVTGIGDDTTVIGYYSNQTNTLGFLRESQGAFEPCNYPGATDTYPISRNASGVVVGQWNDASLKTHGFISTP